MKNTPPSRPTFPILLLLLLALLAPLSAALGSGTVSQCSQADLEAALAGGGTVLFACDGTITLTNTLNIRQDTTLDANGHQVTLSGGGAVRLFTVTNAVFQVNGLTLADGRCVGANDNAAPFAGQPAMGGCLFNQNGTVYFQSCVLTNHSVQGGPAGTNSDGYSYSSGGNGLGGAIYSSGGHLYLTNCQVINCTAVGGEGANYAGFGAPDAGASGLGRGGALCVVGSSLTLSRVTLVNNSATGGLGESSATGAINNGGDAWAGALFASNSLVYAATTVLSGNAAVGGSSSASGWSGGGDGHGGALFLAGTSQGVFNQCVFSANSATGGNPRSAHLRAGSGLGGAVFNQAQFQALNCTFQGNVAAGSSFASESGERTGQGGAVYSTLSTVLTGCTFSGNTAHGGWGYLYYGPLPGGPGQGGAVWSSGTLAATNSTWSDNRAAGGQYPWYVGWAEGDAAGGALYLNGGAATLMNVTIANNYAGPDPGLMTNGLAQGGAIMNANNSTVLLRGSLLAYSTRTVSNYSSNQVTSCSNVWGTVTDGGYNLSSDTTGGFTATGSVTNTDPLLGALADNGGPTLTMSLAPGSPARDQIPAGFPPTDQRGVARPQGALADIGAVEAPTNPSAHVLVQSVPSGLTLLVDGGWAVTTPHDFYWDLGSCHTLDASAFPPGPAGVRSRLGWASWSDGGDVSHQVCATGDTNLTAFFENQYFLDVTGGTNAGGTVNPASRWYSEGEVVSLSATPKDGFTFSGWTGTCSGTDNPLAVTMTNPVSETAWFTYTNPCTFALSTSNATVSPLQEGGVVWVLNADTNCPWSISVPCDWVHVTSGSQDAPAVNYWVEPNTSTNARVCTLTLAGLPYTLTQVGTCLPQFAFASTNIGPNAFVGSIPLAANGGCPWSVGSSSDWLHTASSGSDPGLVIFSVDPNLGTNARQAQLTVEDQTFTVVQQAMNGIAAPVFAKGTYQGLFYNLPGAQLQSSGGLALSTTAGRAFSGRLFLSGTSYPFHGQLDTAGQGDVSVPRRGKDPLSLHLLLEGQNSLVGTVTSASENWNAVLHADRVVPTNSCPYAGQYTWIIPGSTNPAALPGGDSWGTLRVSAAGAVTLAGSLADGTPLTQGTSVTPDGRLPLFVSLAHDLRLLLGWTYFSTEATNQVSGQALWFKAPASAKSARYYPGAMSETVQVYGAKYTPPAAGQSAFGFTNGVVMMAGGNLPSPLTNLVQVSPHQKLLPADQSAAPARLQFNLSPASGKFSGVFSLPPSRTSYSFHGVMLQDLNWGFGYFLGTNQSGYVRIGPANQ